ncbi:uncharacterized protein LOC131236088 isoform X2 [Magnolia sinica]|uniref:uncharacterized protein LOC131236088 isoform X2 n=1 Tax=Magnolia sinica TaxID=86752 RepID=UPI002659BB9A|nr:uncharacterized protein LOC131236088 isoform X2 [Magnolia sinica]
MAPLTALSISGSGDFSEISSSLVSNFKFFPFTDGSHQSGRKRGVFPFDDRRPSFPNLSQSLSPIFHRAADSRFLLFRLFIHRRSTPPHRLVG